MRRLCRLILCATLGAAAPGAWTASPLLGKPGEPIRAARKLKPPIGALRATDPPPEGA